MQTVFFVEWCVFTRGVSITQWLRRLCELCVFPHTVMYRDCTRVGASACALTTLVVMEMLRACCAVSETQSLVTKPPWANRWLLLGVTLPMLLHLSVLYTPRLAAIFQLAPLSQQDWFSVASLSLPLVLLEELLKLLARCLHVS